MEHKMNLWHGPFSLIKAGKKNVELRLNDEKRQKIQPGHTIVFTDAETGEIFRVQVTGKQVFADFGALYAAYEKERIGYLPQETADPKDMEAFYPPEKQQAFGVVAIEIQG